MNKDVRTNKCLIIDVKSNKKNVFMRLTHTGWEHRPIIHPSWTGKGVILMCITRQTLVVPRWHSLIIIHSWIGRYLLIMSRCFLITGFKSLWRMYNGLWIKRTRTCEYVCWVMNTRLQHIRFQIHEGHLAKVMQVKTCKKCTSCLSDANGRRLI